MQCRWWIGASLVVATVLALSGCSSVSSGIDQALGDAVSATGTAKLATHLQLDGRAPLSYVATAYGDALTELQGAEHSVTELNATPAQAHHRAAALAGIRRAVDVLLVAQQDINSGASLSPDEPTLAAALAALKKLQKP